MDLTEAQTRVQLIDNRLALAGWHVKDHAQVIEELEIHLRADQTAYPNPQEQERIADRYEAIDARLREDEETVAKLSDLKRGLMHDLLSGKVEVPIQEEERT